jgi:hypothetical protein
LCPGTEWRNQAWRCSLMSRSQRTLPGYRNLPCCPRGGKGSLHAVFLSISKIRGWKNRDSGSCLRAWSGVEHLTRKLYSEGLWTTFYFCWLLALLLIQARRPQVLTMILQRNALDFILLYSFYSRCPRKYPRQWGFAMFRKRGSCRFGNGDHRSFILSSIDKILKNAPFVLTLL